MAASNSQYAEFKRKYDLSRRTVTRTDYEVRKEPVAHSTPPLLS